MKWIFKWKFCSVRVTVHRNRLFAEGEPEMPLEVLTCRLKCDSLTWNEQVAFIEIRVALYSGSIFHLEAFVSTLTMTVFWTVDLLRV